MSALAGLVAAAALGVWIGRTWTRMSPGGPSAESEGKEAVLKDALRRSAEEWREIFDAVDAAIIVFDAGLKVRRMNRIARELIGRTYDETIGAPLPDHVDEPMASARSAASRVVEEGRADAIPRVVAQDGGIWEVAASPAVGAHLFQGGAIVLVRDVTVGERLQASLRRSERMSAMGTLVAGVAHEVRNPLFALSATVDAFEAEYGNREEYREYANLLRLEVSRLSDLMHDLLEYGRPVAEQLSQRPLAEIIEQALRNCAKQAQSAGVSLRKDLKLTPEPLAMEPRRLTQVFQNLVQNAIQHSSRGSEVIVSGWEEAENSLCCRVEDSGPGFEEQDLTSVFEPFFSRRRGGSGLGLSIVQRIVEEHAGEVVVGNRPEGGGSVTVQLPRRPAPAVESAP